MNIKELNCVNCGQNVLINGLKIHNRKWKCRNCIKSEGVDLTNVSAILFYDNPTDNTPLTYQTRDMILRKAGFNNTIGNADGI